VKRKKKPQLEGEVIEKVGKNWKVRHCTSLLLSLHFTLCFRHIARITFLASALLLLCERREVSDATQAMRAMRVMCHALSNALE
jgi:hypothetical protein